MFRWTRINSRILQHLCFIAMNDKYFREPHLHLEVRIACWIYYKLGLFRFNKLINSIVCNCGQYELYRIKIPRVLDLTYMVRVIPLKLRS